MRQLDRDLWVVETPLRALLVVEVGRRMTVVRLSSGELFLHSVARLTSELRAALDALGPVRFVVSPSRMHHFFMEQYAAAWPQAELVASPGLARRRRDLEFGLELGREPDPRWAADLDQTVFEGLRFLREVVFLHRVSRTLILTDLCFRFGPEAPAATRWMARARGVYGRFGVPRDLQRLVVDRAAARASLERVLAWDFDRVIIAHGRMAETGGRALVERAFDWLR